MKMQEEKQEKNLGRLEKLELEEKTATETFGRFIAQPFDRGYGNTIGNSLRRVLLSSIEGAAITSVTISSSLVFVFFSPVKIVSLSLNIFADSIKAF